MMNNPLLAARPTTSHYDFEEWIDEQNETKLAIMNDWFFYPEHDDFNRLVSRKLEFNATSGWYRENEKQAKAYFNKVFGGNQGLIDEAYRRACNQRDVRRPLKKG